MKLMRYLDTCSRVCLYVASAALIILIGVFDYVTGTEMSFSIFYVIPIALLAWHVGMHAGMVISVAAATVWLLANMLGGVVYSHPALPYWNALVRLGFFLIVTCALSTVRTAHRRQEELGQFIVHDLRSPLSTVMTGLRMLEDVAGDAIDATQHDLIEMCTISCDRMLTLVNSILDLARLESGRMPLQVGEIHVAGLVSASLRQVSVWAQRNEVHLTSHLAPDVKTVQGDAVVTGRILVNLLSNAIKFSPPASTVSVDVSSCSPTMVAFSVADQGRGMGQEWVEKVFDKFAQTEVGRVRGEVGSGLGLTFCRLAVEAQGGHISLASEINVGTTVTFTLPVHR